MAARHPCQFSAVSVLAARHLSCDICTDPREHCTDPREPFFFICSMTQKQHKKFCSVCSFCLLVFSSHCLPMSWIRSIVLCMTNTLLWRRHASRSKKISESSNQAFVVLCPCGCPTFLGVWCLSFRFLPSKRSLRFTFFFPVCTE